MAGKGLEAARRAAFVRTALATSAPYTDDPCRLLELANAALLELGPRPDDMLVTCAVLAFTPVTHTLTYALAGHPPPMWDNGKPLNHLKPAFPLGVESFLDCESSSTTFAPGAGLIAFTDGLSEARRRGGELFGTEPSSARCRSCAASLPRAWSGSCATRRSASPGARSLMTSA